MKLLYLIAAFAAAALAMAAPARAQNYPWCANFHDGAGVNCGFPSYQSCMDTVRGSGGFCSQNNSYRAAGGTTPSRRPGRKHRGGKRL